MSNHGAEETSREQESVPKYQPLSTFPQPQNPTLCPPLTVNVSTVHKGLDPLTVNKVPVHIPQLSLCDRKALGSLVTDCKLVLLYKFNK